MILKRKSRALLAMARRGEITCVADFRKDGQVDIVVPTENSVRRMFGAPRLAAAPPPESSCALNEAENAQLKREGQVGGS